MTYTEADFDRLSWHDCHIWGVDFLDRRYYRWTLRLNWPTASEISFGAVGFTQTLRAEPVLTNKQCLSLSERNGLAR